jgi:peptidoglycan/xylan/chitin deacetylase (PgdA/CDA1 family)
MHGRQPAARDKRSLTMMFRSIPNKREFLARIFGRTGVIWLLEQTLARQRPGLVVLTYHRIAEPGADSFYDPVISATPEAFRTQVDWLHNHARLLTVNELIDRVESGSPWHEPTMFITFDDGYRDNFDLAVPILAEHKAPATFFVPSAFVESPRLPWWDHVACAIKRTHLRRFVLERCPKGGLPPLEFDLQTVSRSAAIMMIIRAFLDGTIADERWFLNQLTERAMVEIDSEGLARQLFMSSAQMQKMVNSGTGLTIGSHAHSHRKLAKLDEDIQLHELAGSKQILEARLGCPIKVLAYPYGWAGTYTVGTKALAAQAGYHLAFSSREGINRLLSIDRYEISRLGVGSADSITLLRARSMFHAAFGKSFL